MQGAVNLHSQVGSSGAADKLFLTGCVVREVSR